MSDELYMRRVHVRGLAMKRRMSRGQALGMNANAQGAGSRGNAVIAGRIAQLRATPLPCIAAWKPTRSGRLRS